jgi:hypothetical protein
VLRHWHISLASLALLSGSMVAAATSAYAANQREPELVGLCRDRRKWFLHQRLRELDRADSDLCFAAGAIRKLLGAAPTATAAVLWSKQQPMPTAQDRRRSITAAMRGTRPFP